MEQVTSIMEQVTTILTNYVPQLVGAIAVLIVGWIVAAFVAAGVRRAIERTKMGARLRTWVAGDEEDATRLVKWTSRIIFYVLFMFVLVAFFQVLGLNEITSPIVAFLNEIFAYAPRLLGPFALAIVAWLVAGGLRLVVRRGLKAANVDQKLGSHAELPGMDTSPISQTLGDVVYWVTLLLFLPAILGALELRGLLEPVSGMVDELLAFLPNFLAAAIILLVGWLVARIIRRVTTNVLSSIGIDGLSEQAKLTTVLGEQRLSGLVGLVVYILVLVPVIVGALNALKLEAITAPASEMLLGFLGALPNIFAATLLLVIAYVVARIIAGFANNLMVGIGIDKIFAKMGISAAAPDSRVVTDTITTVIFVGVMIFASIEALRLLGFDAVAELGSNFLVFGVNIALGLAILGLGLFLASISANWIAQLDITGASALSVAARIVIIVLATAIGLGEMGIAEEIITLAFGILFGAIALTAAIAFGVGGRDTAGELMRDWVTAITGKTKGESKSDAVEK